MPGVFKVVEGKAEGNPAHLGILLMPKGGPSPATSNRRSRRNLQPVPLLGCPRDGMAWDEHLVPHLTVP